MSNQPPYPGAPGSEGGPDEPTRHPTGGRPPYGPTSGQPPQGNPYGGQPPANPYGQPPQQGPYGQPGQGQPGQGQSGQNPYGPPPQNPYAQPQQGNPYGQPGYGQPGQGQPGYSPQQPGQPGAGGPQPQQYGGGGGRRKKWLVPVLVVVVLALVGGGVLAVFLVQGGEDSSTSVADLSGGDCLTSTDIADASSDIDDIATTGCSEDHDAEVFATFELGSDEVEDFDIDAAGSTCVEELESAGVSLDDLTSDGNEVRPLVASDDPSEGDAVVCFIRNSDGEKLSEQIVE